MAAFNPAKFFREVRQEAAKITWPTWKETRITALMVALMTVIFAIFLGLVDFLAGSLIRSLPDLFAWLVG